MRLNDSAMPSDLGGLQVGGVQVKSSTLVPRVRSAVRAATASARVQRISGTVQQAESGWAYPLVNPFTVSGCGSVGLQRRVLELTWHQTETLKWEKRNRRLVQDRARTSFHSTPVLALVPPAALAGGANPL